MKVAFYIVSVWIWGWCSRSVSASARLRGPSEEESSATTVGAGGAACPVQWIPLLPDTSSLIVRSNDLPEAESLIREGWGLGLFDNSHGQGGLLCLATSKYCLIQDLFNCSNERDPDGQKFIEEGDLAIGTVLWDLICQHSAWTEKGGKTKQRKQL